MKKRFLAILLWLGLSLAWTARAPVFAGDAESAGGLGSLWKHLEVRTDILGYGTFNGVKDSEANPNNVLGVPGSFFEMAIRPDFFFTLSDHRVFLELRPRLAISRTAYNDGIYRLKNATTEAEVYVNEWLARYGVTRNFFVSMGRENLQWGPSFLLSPSNPFYQDNGKNNPNLEPPGLDYARAVFIPNGTLSFSLAANVGEGRWKNAEPFKKTYALKTDLTSQKKYGSLILSKKDAEAPVFGFYGGLTVTDYLLLHTEGRWSMESGKGAILLGGAATFSDGSTLALEYFHQGEGCIKEPAFRCKVADGFYEELNERFEDPTTSPDALLREIEGLGLSPDTEGGIRRNYFMTQYVKPRMLDAVTLTSRWIFDADDASNRIVGIGSCTITGHLELHVVGNLYIGGRNTEYGSLLNRSLMVGVTVRF